MDLYFPIAEVWLNPGLLVGLGLGVGFLSGMLGTGGGVVMTPALMLLGVAPVVAVGTGASQVVAVTASSALIEWRRGHIDFKISLHLLAGGLIGIASGHKILQYMKALGQLDL